MLRRSSTKTHTSAAPVPKIPRSCCRQRVAGATTNAPTSAGSGRRRWVRRRVASGIKQPSPLTCGLLCSFSYSVGAGRFDGRLSKGRLLMRDRHAIKAGRLDRAARPPCPPQATRTELPRPAPLLPHGAGARRRQPRSGARAGRSLQAAHHATLRTRHRRGSSRRDRATCG